VFPTRPSSLHYCCPKLCVVCDVITSAQLVSKKTTLVTWIQIHERQNGGAGELWSLLGFEIRYFLKRCQQKIVYFSFGLAKSNFTIIVPPRKNALGHHLKKIIPTSMCRHVQIWIAKKKKEPSRLIRWKLTANLELLILVWKFFSKFVCCYSHEVSWGIQYYFSA